MRTPAPIHDSALIAYELLEVLQPVVAALRDQREYLADQNPVFDALPDHIIAEIRNLDEIINRAESRIRRAHAALRVPREAIR